jgi:hypothetical protein
MRKPKRRPRSCSTSVSAKSRTQTDGDFVIGYGVLRAFTDGAEIVADGPFGAAHIRGDADRRDFVTERLCDTIRINPVRKQVTGNRVAWSVRMRRDGDVTKGTGEILVGPEGVSELRLRSD